MWRNYVVLLLPINLNFHKIQVVASILIILIEDVTLEILIQLGLIYLYIYYFTNICYSINLFHFKIKQVQKDLKV